jgi:hypothetical protein
MVLCIRHSEVCSDCEYFAYAIPIFQFDLSQQQSAAALNSSTSTRTNGRGRPCKLVGLIGSQYLFSTYICALQWIMVNYMVLS